MNNRNKKTAIISQMPLSTAQTTYTYIALVLAILALSGSAYANPTLSLNTYDVEMCPCSTSRIIGTLDTTPPGTYSIGTDSSWTTVVPSRLALGAGEAGKFYVYVTPDCLTPPGTQQVKISADSEVGSASATAKLNILECHGAALSTTAGRKTACIDDVATIKISVKNTGKTEETYSISADYGEVEPETLTISAGQTKDATLYATPKSASQTITVTAASTSSYAKKTMPIELLGENCYSSNLAVTPQKQSVCQSLVATYTMVLENTGTRADTYTISSELGTLGTIPLASGKQKTIILEIPTKNKTFGDSKFYVTVEQASRPEVRVSKEVDLAIENCYSASISAEKQAVSVCPGMPAKYTMLVANTGKLDDKYKLSSNKGVLESSSISLRAGEKKNTSLTLGTALNDSKSQEVQVSLSSENLKSEIPLTLSLGFESFKDCYDFEVSAEPTTLGFKNRTSGITVVKIKNTGKDNLNFVLKMDGPSWAYLDPSELEIAPGQTGEAYVYAAPIFGTANGVYPIKVQATNNGKVSKTAQANAVVGNQTAQSNNQSTPTGNATGAASLKKTIILIVLGVVVIAAIIILPGMFSRKKEEPVELKSDIRTEVEPELTAVIEGIEGKKAEPEESSVEETPAEKPKKKRGRPAKKKPAESEDVDAA